MSLKPTEALLIIFTRNPEPGKVKTRLATDVGDITAFKIYNFLLEHTVSVTKNLAVSKEVYYSEGIAQNDIWETEIFTKKLQQGEGLGERMKNAFEEGFKNGYQNIIIIGSDLYDLQREDLEKAFQLLQEKHAVIGPATDGGYYLLGMNQLLPEVFENKKWGTSSVLEDTLKNLKGKNIGLLEARNDVDYYSDIKDHKDFQQFFKN
ncbi:TIGR04282 family arsenosugar biosynthesis glycosyltransferase [Salegentibacter sp. BDJ18]|uniref:TIGR04282 family arsenosugar biosynthesis glycosyltransferase n=1 Tax=Salegentibacter sp. BDJ18 TaxID=2816376 RepID=UPI001AAE781D|nr:TIGR04282 family arsenosugar biosynthesis glycosyltransferase [Salegentibacter sp. BDJ18]MBO2543993.1 TIGR04282 family arsenosugar biosynthesis glycosyltransferase [Salegentibacter sp. BDJ18]